MTRPIACLLTAWLALAGAGYAADDPPAEAGSDTAKAGHDETDLDLSHANASSQLEAPEEWKFDLAIYTVVVFLLLLGILMKFAWGPISQGLERRESRIAALIDDAEQSAQKAQEQLRQYEQKLAEAHQEAEGILTRAQQAAQDSADKIVAEAQEAAQREKERAVSEIEVAKNEALGEVTQKSVDIAMGLAGNIIRRQLKAEDHDALIREALEKFSSSRNGG